MPGRPGSSLTLNASELSGRGSASGSGSPEAITLGTNLTMSGTTLNANAGSGAPSGASYIVAAADAGLSDERVATDTATIDFVAGVGTAEWNVIADSIVNTLLANMAARTIKGNPTAASGDPQDITDGGDGTVLGRFGTTLSFSVLTRLLQNLSLEGDISPAQVTADQNNYNPTNLATASVLRISTDASRNFTGLVPGTADGDLKFWINVGSFNSVLVSESVSSTATNRFTGGDVTVAPNETALLYHDPVTDRWRTLLKFLSLGTASYQACAGNDSRLSDSRAPNGAAGGDLTGTYPNPTIGANKVLTAAIADDNVTLAKLAKQAALTVLVNATNATANPTALAFGTDGFVLKRNGTALDTGLIDNANLANRGACSVVGRSANSSGAPADISASTNGHYLSRQANVVGFAAIVAADLPAASASAQGAMSSADFKKLANIADQYKKSVRIKTVGALAANTAGGSGVGKTLTANANGAFPSTDGITLAQNERILVAHEATGANNGVYTLTTVGSAGAAWVLTRATDFDENSEVTCGIEIQVEEGTSYGSTTWRLTTANTITVDTTALTFAKVGGKVSVITLTDAATIAVDASLFSINGTDVARCTLGGNRTLGNWTNATDGQQIEFQMKQDGTGSRTLAYGTNYRFSTDVASPTLTTTASKMDKLLFRHHSTDTKHDCGAVNKGF